MTGVLMQCTSRIPLSYRRKAKAPRRGSRHNQIVASHRCHRGAAMPSMNGLSNFLGRIQCTKPKIALKAKVTFSNHPGASGLTDKPSL